MLVQALSLIQVRERRWNLMAMFVVLLGGPGAGKGTQAQILSKKLGIPQVSTGDLFRYNLKEKTQLGLLAQKYMDRGELVPDEVTVSMVRQRLAEDDCAGGAILDGFPRTLQQADALDELLAEMGERISVAPLIDVSDEVIIERLAARRSCRECGKVYNLLFNPPPEENVCKCGGELYQRDDDKPDTIKNRLYVYYKETSPLIGYYFAQKLLTRISGQQDIDGVQADLLKAVRV